MKFKDRVIKVVKSIPFGRVTTYGTVATLAGEPRRAREVGFILHTFTQKFNLPWQRVVNRNGYLSIRGEQVDMKNLQKALLKKEGIEVSGDFMIDLNRHEWWGDD